MEFSTRYADRIDDLVALFTDTFTNSEGASEGALLGALVDEICTTVADSDKLVVLALDGTSLAGAFCMTRLQYPDEIRTVFLLSPVAVATERQGCGVGQAMLKFGLNLLRQRDVDVVLTYGDVTFYAKVGFALITPATAQPPRPLSYPDGWLGQSLTQAPLAPLRGVSRCVAALDKPELW